MDGELSASCGDVASDTGLGGVVTGPAGMLLLSSSDGSTAGETAVSLAGCTGWLSLASPWDKSSEGTSSVPLRVKAGVSEDPFPLSASAGASPTVVPVGW